jgi:serine protease Do
VRAITRAFARENQLASDHGVMVIGTQPGYPAAEAGLVRGDIVTKIGTQLVGELAELKKVYDAQVANEEPLLVEAQRNRRISFYVLKP